MATISDKEMGLAQVYAQAMLSLAESKGQSDALLEELLDLVKLLDQHPQWARVMTSPHVDAETRRKAIDKAFRGRASDMLTDALQIINRKGRLELIRAIVEAYRLAHEELRGEVDVHVRTAVPLSAALRDQVRDLAAKFSGKKPELFEEVDPSLLGGVSIRIGDDKFDATVSSRLKAAKADLLERASEEIHRSRAYVADMPT